MRAFITGISGFAGNHLSAFLLSKKFQVYGLGTSESAGLSKKISYYKINLLDINKLKKAIKDTKPDFVFHLAGISSVKKCLEQPELCRKINVTGTKNLLESVSSLNIKPKTLVISSAEVYGIPKSIPIKETDDLNPRNPYAKSKKEQENICKKYMKDIPIVIVRSFPHIGPGQKPFFVASDFAKQIAEIEKGEEPIIKVGNLEAKRDFTDVRDIAKAYYLALEKGSPGECYNICSGRVHSIKQLLDILLSMSNIKIKIYRDPKKMRPSDIPVLAGDNTKFYKQTGWKPQIPLKQTLKNLLDYWREKTKQIPNKAL